MVLDKKGVNFAGKAWIVGGVVFVVVALLGVLPDRIIGIIGNFVGIMGVGIALLAVNPDNLEKIKK